MIPPGNIRHFCEIINLHLSVKRLRLSQRAWMRLEVQVPLLHLLTSNLPKVRKVKSDIHIEVRTK